MDRPERRAEPRQKVDLRCWVIEREQMTRFAHLCDVSRQGALIRTALPPSTGTVVTLRLPDEDAGWRETQAEVMWAAAGIRGRGGVMGVRFISVSAD